MRQEKDELSIIFQALSASTRRSILAELAKGDACVADLAEPHNMSLAAVSRHVHVLAKANLLTRHREGKNIRCSLNTAGLQSVDNWTVHYRQFWTQKLDSLKDVLEPDDEQR